MFNVITGDESWIYNYNSEIKQQSTVRVFENEDKRTKVMRIKDANKKMIDVFFRKTGHLARIYLKDQQAITADWYSEIRFSQILYKLLCD